MALTRKPPNILTGGGIDRAAHLRRDPAWLAERLGDPATRLVLHWRGRGLVRWEDELARGIHLAAGEVADSPLEPAELALLGLAGGVPHFGWDLSRLEEAEVVAALGSRGELADLRVVGAVLPAEDAALLAYARGLFHWHQRHGFCGVCGSPTESREAGHVRRCTRCEAEHYPRTDPAVIMLVTRGDRCLLGHQQAWPEGMYSTLAGFLEPGESLEEAVAREVLEEAGVEVEDVEYHSSQPWPFPGSLMLGFVARAASEEIHLHDGELADARWFTREELRDPAARSIRLPSPISIARRLVEDWLADDSG